jgi:hypothetical protein
MSCFLAITPVVAAASSDFSISCAFFEECWGKDECKSSNASAKFSHSDFVLSLNHDEYPATSFTAEEGQWIITARSDDKFVVLSSPPTDPLLGTSSILTVSESGSPASETLVGYFGDCEVNEQWTS